MEGNRNHWRDRVDLVLHGQHQSRAPHFRPWQVPLVPCRVSFSSCTDYMAFRLHIGDDFASKLRKLERLLYPERSHASVAYWRALYRGSLHAF